MVKYRSREGAVCVWWVIIISIIDIVGKVAYTIGDLEESFSLEDIIVMLFVPLYLLTIAMIPRTHYVIDELLGKQTKGVKKTIVKNITREYKYKLLFSVLYLTLFILWAEKKFMAILFNFPCIWLLARSLVYFIKLRSRTSPIVWKVYKTDCAEKGVVDVKFESGEMDGVYHTEHGYWIRTEMGVFDIESRSFFLSIKPGDKLYVVYMIKSANDDINDEPYMIYNAK